MTYSEYIGIAEENDLFKLTKSLLIKEHRGFTKSSKFLDLLYDEAQKRKSSFYQNALKEAYSIVSSIDDLLHNPGHTKVIEMFNLEKLNAHSIKVLNHPVIADNIRTKTSKNFQKVEECFNSDNEYFLCKISGDDLTDLNIKEGTELLVRKRDNASNGQLVIVSYNNKIAVKKIYKKAGKTFLLSGHNNENKIDVSDQDFKILGIVVEIFNGLKA